MLKGSLTVIVEVFGESSVCCMEFGVTGGGKKKYAKN
jgi:hypothetical protein